MQPPKCSYLHFSEKSLPYPHMDKRSCSRYLCFIASFLPVSRNLAPPRSSHCAHNGGYNMAYGSKSGGMKKGGKKGGKKK
jgi:hypothetical protein